MTKLEDTVNEILGIDVPEVKENKEFTPTITRVEEKAKDDVDNDHKNSREYYYNLIDQGQEAIAGILEVAKAGEHPRAYEVALAGIKSVADTVDKLQDLNIKLNRLKEVPKSANPQIKNALFHLKNENWKSIVLAYEPVWAIGTGQTASPEQAQEMHSFIRNLVKENYNSTISEDVSILYGGSVKPENAKEIFGKNDVDGGLIGGAALNADNFMAIVNAF